MKVKVEFTMGIFHGVFRDALLKYFNRQINASELCRLTGLTQSEAQKLLSGVFAKGNSHIEII